jgi:hypothetical protein
VRVNSVGPSYSASLATKIKYSDPTTDVHETA